MEQVILNDVGPKKIGAISVIRELTGLGLSEAKAVCENTPSTLDSILSDEGFNRCVNELKSLGASIDVIGSDSGDNNFGDELELELPTLDEMLGSDSNEAQHSLDECFDWIRKMADSYLSLDDPIGEFESGDYDTALESVKDYIENSNLPDQTNQEYFNSFKKHIELKKGVENSSSSEEELTLDFSFESKTEEPTPAPIPPNNNDLKQQYSQKIASGEIDPIEVSFADFEAASKNKEIDYKAVYSQMISEGRIDPTETSYNEMIKVSKLFGGVDESEYKATYSKYIGSGEIDPSETTYDEIVNIANIFNEINGGSSSGGAITKEQLIAELKTFIATFDDEDNKEYATEYLEEENYWSIIEEYTNIGNPLIDKVFAYYINIAQTFSDYSKIAYNYHNFISDDENCRKYYEIAEQKIENFDDAEDLGKYIAEEDVTLEDKIWARKLFEKALKLADEEFANLRSLGCTVADDSYLNDKTWAREIFQKAYQNCNSVKELTDLASSVIDSYYLEDKSWGRELLKEAESKATTFEEYILVLHRVLDEEFNDTEWADRLVEIILSMATTATHYDSLIVELYETKKELATELVFKAIMVMENDDEKDAIAESAEWNLENEELANEIRESSIEDLKNKYGKPSTEELKKLYAAGIGDGSIDPVETSFDSFEKNYGKSSTSSNSNDQMIKVEASLEVVVKDEDGEFLDSWSYSFDYNEDKSTIEEIEKYYGDDIVSSYNAVIDSDNFQAKLRDELSDRSDNEFVVNYISCEEMSDLGVPFENVYEYEDLGGDRDQPISDYI